MSPSWRTMPPISCTSKRRTPIWRLNASRTAANASKRISSSVSPFASRSRNSVVFPRSSSSLSCSKSGSSVPMYFACWASRFPRRPSPRRRTFSKLPNSVVGTRLGYRLRCGCQGRRTRVGDSLSGGLFRGRGRSEGIRVNLPEVAVEPVGVHDVVGTALLADSLELRDRPVPLLAVEAHGSGAADAGEIELVAGVDGQRDHLDSLRRHAPEVAFLPPRGGAVR